MGVIDSLIGGSVQSATAEVIDSQVKPLLAVVAVGAVAFILALWIVR